MDAVRSLRQDGDAGVRATSLLVGRAREQVFLREELAATFGGRGRLVLLGGVAGIGKTALARDLAREAEELGVRVLTGHCYDLTNTPPYGPWLALFGSEQTQSLGPEPPSAFAGGRLEHVTDQAALFADVRRFLAETAQLSPTVVVLEDLHWADPASIELLRHVGPYVRQWRLLLLVTYRVDDLTRHHPLYQQLPALVREADGVRLDPRRLDEEALGALVSGRYRLSGLDEGRLVAYLGRHAEGNPFFTVELLRALEEAGLLRTGVERSSLGELARVVVPPLLRQVIDGRVARLGEETRQPLAMAAVIGQEVPLDLWTSVTGLGDETLLEIVERAVDARLVDAMPDGTRVRFVHALTREALYEGVLPPRRRLWHRQVAETLMAGSQPDPDAVAYHLQQAGDPRAWEWLKLAGERAQRAYAWLTAIDRFRAAADLLAGVDGTERMRGHLLYLIARLRRLSHPADAIADVDEAARLAAISGDDILAAEVYFHRGILLCYLNQFRDGLAELAAGIETLEAMPFAKTRASNISEFWLVDSLPVIARGGPNDDEVAHTRLHAAGFHFRRSAHPWFLAAAGRIREADDIAGRYVATLEGLPVTSGAIRATAAFSELALGISRSAFGFPATARDAFARSRVLFEAIDHQALIALTFLQELQDVALTYEVADPSVRCGLAAETEAALERAGGALRPGLSPRLAWLGCFLLDGRWDEVDRLLQILPEPGNAFLLRAITAARATLAHHRGDPDGAWAEIRPHFPDGPATEPGDNILQEGLFLQRLASELCLDVGDLTVARAWLEAHDRWLAWSGGVLGRASGQLAWSQWHRATGDSERARAMATEARELAAVPAEPLVRLAADRLLGEIATAERDLDAADSHLRSSLEFATICEVPFERAQTLVALADVHLARGEADQARVVLGEVSELATTLRAGTLRSRADALLARSSARQPMTIHPMALTQREIDVLRLLAGYRTDKEIAAELFIGARTVQTHVANILGKLGVENRREAAIEAVRLGLV